MMRLILSLCLALMLACTSQAMAVAKGAAAATGKMVICNGDGTMVVYTDAQGAPTAAPHICPDCVAGLALIEVPKLEKAPLRIVTVEIPAPVVTQMVPVFARLGPPSRAPPLFA